MKRHLTIGSVALGLILLPAVARAQILEGYLGGGVGGWSNRYTDGQLLGGMAGFDVNVTPFTAVEGEVELFAAQGELATGFSAGGRLRFRRPLEGRAVPFVTGGVTHLKFFELSAGAWYAGGGVEFVRTDRRSIRVEFHDTVRTDYPSHLWVVRVGVAFR